MCDKANAMCHYHVQCESSECVSEDVKECAHLRAISEAVRRAVFGSECVSEGVGAEGTGGFDEHSRCLVGFGE
jgi:hypothetical protein